MFIFIKKVMKLLLALFVVVSVMACRQKMLSGPELQQKLIETMQNYLDKEDHPGIVFTVKDVTYFPEVKKKTYDCEFKVAMRTAQRDTTGSMLAYISNDFKTVQRTR
jgi:hypothetical protein